MRAQAGGFPAVYFSNIFGCDQWVRVQAGGFPALHFISIFGCDQWVRAQAGGFPALYDGKRLPGDGRFILMRKLTSEERSRRGDGSRILTRPEAGGLLQNAIYIYIYIYTQTQLFEVSIWGGFWRGFGEVSGEIFREQKSQKHCVLQ